MRSADAPPTDVLGAIVEHKRHEVAARKERRPLAKLVADAEPSSRSLASALAGDAVGLILESKRMSPSHGPIREPYDPAAIARSYAPFA
ncbi:MAG: indole-3-glycerol-phosphate synthase TrpC, partial [Gemmatimonadetes bacterium]|nr:indole-3-glycerol-phosphate synthase TrpC [Gemmatimonadota bacterium]